MTAEEHRAYVDYPNLARPMEDMERQRIYANFLLSEERKESKKIPVIKVFSEFRQKQLILLMFLATLK